MHNPRCANKTPSEFGCAGSRSPEQEEAARAMVAALLASFGDDDLEAWTDGSAHGNPGPCGAGSLLVDHSDLNFEAQAVAALGKGTNNLGVEKDCAWSTPKL